MTDNERAVIRQARNDIYDALHKSEQSKLTMYSESRIRAAIKQLDSLLQGEVK